MELISREVDNSGYGHWVVGHSIVFTFRFITGSLQTNKIPAILGRYPLLGFFCRLKTVPLDRDNGTFNSSNTDVVEKVNFLVAA